MERNAGTSCCKLGVRVSGSYGSVAAAAQYHSCLTSVTNTSVLRVLPRHSAISAYFLHYIDERSERCDLFSKDVVTVERALMWQPGPGLWPSWKRGTVVCMQSKQASMLLLLLLITQSLIVQDKLLHAPFTGWLLIHRGPEYPA